jgi:hypothetical protein
VAICDIVRTPDYKANAQLIASAPELLEALEELVCVCENIGNFDNGVECNGFNEGEVIAGKAIKQAQAAIKKARGEYV